MIRNLIYATLEKCLKNFPQLRNYFLMRIKVQINLYFVPKKILGIHQ